MGPVSHLAYNTQSTLHRDSANDGFHEGIGDTIALSITPEYLVNVGLLDAAPPPEGDLGLLMKLALDKVAFLHPVRARVPPFEGQPSEGTAVQFLDPDIFRPRSPCRHRQETPVR